MSDKYVAYVGSYTHEDGKGIHIFDMDVEKGRIKERKEIKLGNPSYITLSHSGLYLYSICDNGVASYRILEDGDLEPINVHTIRGMRGCHITINKKDTFLIVSGYYDGKITVLRINEDGSVGDIVEELFHKGIGSVAERNFRPHISCAEFTPDEELLCVCDLGIDQIKVYEFNHQTGKLKLYEIIRTQLDSAPRQITFSPDGRFAYVVCELKNYINVYSYDKDNGNIWVTNVDFSYKARDGYGGTFGSVEYRSTPDKVTETVFNFFLVTPAKCDYRVAVMYKENEKKYYLYVDVTVTVTINYFLYQPADVTYSLSINGGADITGDGSAEIAATPRSSWQKLTLT